MSLTTDSERSEHEPPPAGLRSPLYGTATFTSLSPSSAPAPLTDSGGSSARLSYPSRSVTPSTSDDGTHLRRVAISPTVSSYDSRRYSDSDSYLDDNDNSIDDTAEVEDVLSRVDDEISQVLRGENWNSGDSSSGISASSKSATGSYTTATTEPLNFDRERRVLSTISERTESQSLNSGIGTGTGIFQNLFSSTFSRPSSLFSSAARSFYGAPASPLAPPPSISAAARPATPERTFKPAPPSGRRVGNLVASFESDLSLSRPGSVPLGPRSPSPYSSSSRSSSPTKSLHTRAHTEGSYTHSRSYTDGGISASGHSQSASFSTYLSPPPPVSAFSRTTLSGSSETERPRSPLSSVRNIVAAWKERSPEKASSSASRSTASHSAISGPSYSSSSASSAGFGFGDGIFSLRRRATLTATNSGRRSGGSPPSYTDDFGSATGSVTGTRSIARSGSVRSNGGSSIFDISELDSFIRGSQNPLRVGQLWYLNVHALPPFRWQRCRAILYPNTLLLSWIAPGGGRGVVTLDLVNCNEVRSVPSPSHLSARDDIGTVAAHLQMDERGSDIGDYDLVEMLCPFQLLYSDGVERLGAESARERVRWVSAIWEALDRAVGPPDRSTTRSPTGSIRTIRSVTSSVVSTGSGSATTTYLPPLDSIPDLPDFDATTFTQTLSPRNSLSASSLSSYALTRTRSSDDGAISSRGGLLHPLDARSIEIAPSRSSSLRRTSSLADLDAEFASVLRGSGITLDSHSDTRTRTRGGSSRFSARWMREPSDYGGASSTISPSESASAAGVKRRVRASTFYTLSASSQPTFTQGALESSSSDATEIVPSSLSLRGPSSASLLGDSHSGPTSTEETERIRSPPSPSTPTRSRSPETLYTSTSGLSRASAVRRRTPRTARTYSQSASTRSGPTTESTSDKENEYNEPSQWSSLQGSYTTTSYEYSDYIATTRALSESGGLTSPLAPRSVTGDSIEEREARVRARPRKPESESDDDVFLTPTAARTASSYHSAPGTPTPSSASLPSTEYDTAVKASSTEYATAEVCPSTPPMTETEYLTAECRCKPAAPSIPEEVGTLTPSLSLTSLTDEKLIDTEVASLYAPSEVPTIPSVIEGADIPLPESEAEESPLRSLAELEKTPSVSVREPTTPSSESSELQPSTIPTPTVIPPTPSSVTETSAQTTTSLTPSTESSAPPPSSPSSPSIVSVPLTPSSPSSPTSVNYKSESSRTPKSRSLYVPSHSSVKSSPSVTDGYETSFFAPSPSLHSIPMQDPVDVSFETSFMRPGASELFSDQAPSPFLPKGLGAMGLSSTVTPTSTTTNSTTSISQTPTVTRTWGTPDPPTPSSVTTASSLSMTSERTPTVSSLTPSSAMLTVPPVRSAQRSVTPSSLTPSSYIQDSQAASSAPYTSVSSLTPSGPFEGDSILDHTVTVSRTPSSVSTISTTSMNSSVFAPTIYDEAIESPATVPTLLSSRATTPRPTTPRGVPLPSSPSLSFATATPTASISTPRTDAQSLHTLTSVATSDVIEAPREEILTHDVNRLLRYLHDLDQIRGGETQDMKDHLQRIEDELRDLADFLRKPEVSTKDRSVGGSAQVSGPRSITRPQSPVSESLEYVSTAPQPTVIGQRPLATSGSTSPLPVPEPRGVRTPSVRSLTPPPQMLSSPSYSPSTITEGMSYLTSPHSDDFSLMSLEDYPAVPISAPGSPSSPSSPVSGLSFSSTEAPWPPSSVTPSSDPRSSMVAGAEHISDLTPESPFLAVTPVPAASPLASLASAESVLPMPPESMTPSQEAAAATPLPASPMPAARYAGSPLLTSTPFASSSATSSLSSATPPPSSSMPSSSSPPSIARGPPSVAQVRQPISPVLSMSEPELPSPVPPTPEIARESPGLPVRMPEPVLPQMDMPVPEFPPLETVPPSPSLSIHTVRPGSDRSGGSRALDDLRDLLEDLRGQAQALWNGQLATNRMLDDLVERRPPIAPAPAVGDEEMGNRLRNIEGLLDGILRDLARGGLGSEEPSEISSDTSSALRRYIDRLRDRRQEPLHMPTPIRAPPPNLDSEWLEFLSEPPPVPEQPIHGPPPLVPLYRRSARRPREESMSPPLTIESPIRIRSVPLEESIPYAFSPPLSAAHRLDRIPRAPRLPQRPERTADVGGTPLPGFRDWLGDPRRPVRHPTRRPTQEDIDMLRQIHQLRQARRGGGDGRIDATVPPDQSPVLEEVPPPPRVHTAPPWYRPSQVRPGQTLDDAPHVVPTPAAPPPQPLPGAQTGVPPPMMPMPGVPFGIPMTGPPPPFNEMLDLLRQNRLAQTASIDQQREIMRYMRGLNQWLEHDVRDRQNEMRSIGARVDALRDALRNELGRLGVPGGGAPVSFPPTMPGQPQGPQGQTFIVPPLPQAQPFVPPGMPGGPPVIPEMSMPQPQVPFTPGPFGQQMPGAGPPVMPPFQDGRAGSVFIPPRPGMADAPVIPDFERFPRPGEPLRPPPEGYADQGPGYEEPFIPPRPPPTPGMVPVPPPQGVPGQPITVLPPMPMVERSSSPSDSRSSRSSSPRSRPSPRLPDINIHVPSPPPQQMQPSQQAPPAVVRMGDQGERLPSGPLHPDLTGVYSQPTALPQQPSQPVVIVPPPAPVPTLPSAFPGEQRFQSPPRQPVVIQTDRPYSPSRSYADDQRPVVVVQPSRSRSRSGSPTRVLIHAPGSRPSYRDDSRSPHRRLQRTHTGPSEYSDRPRRQRRRSYTPSISSSPHRRHRRRPSYEDADRGRGRSRTPSPSHPIIIRSDSRRSRTPPQVILQPSQQQPQFIAQPLERLRSRSSSRSSRTRPIIVQQPSRMQSPPPVMLGDPGYAQPPTQPVVIVPPTQAPSQGPLIVPPPMAHTGYDEGRTRYSPSPPRTHVPAGAQALPSRYEDDRGRPRSRSPEVRVAHESRSPSPRRSYSPRDEGTHPSRLRRPRHSRSRSYSPRRDGSRQRYRDDDPRGRRRGSPEYSEGDPRRRRPSRSPVRHEGDRGRRPSSRSPTRHEGDRGRRPSSRSPTRYEGDRGRRPSSRSPTRYEGDRRRRQPSRSPTYEEGDRPGRRRSPIYEGDRPRRSRSPEYHEGRPHRRDYSPARSHRPVTAVHYSPSGRPLTEREYERTPPTIRRSSRSQSPSDRTRIVRIPTHPSHISTGQPRPVYTEGDAGIPVSHPGRVRSESPTRVVIHTRPRSPSPERVVIGPQPPAAPTYAGPESAYEPESQVIRVPTTESHRPGRAPSRIERPPTVVRMDSGRLSPRPSHLEEDYLEAPISVHPSYEPTIEGAHPVRPPSPRTAIHSAIHGARSDTEPVVPLVPTAGHVPSRIPPEPIYEHDEGVPQVVRTHRPGRTPDIYEPGTPSGPGDLALHDALQAHQERLEEQERRLEELGRAAVDAEERREQYFRDHEEERQRLFQENEERRIRDAAELRDEVEHTLQEIPHPPVVPPQMEQPAISVGGPPAEGVEPVESVTAPGAEAVSFHDAASIAESARPVPPPMQPIAAEGMPQLQEILDLLRAQQAETADCKAAEAERFDALRDEIAEARADAKAECEERIRMLEDELARAREELELERGQRRAEELERIEREHADVIERDEAVRAQLGDITNIVQEQHEELAHKRELMDERWQEKQLRREQKQGRNDVMYEMLERIIQEREQERTERDMERAAAAERPSIEHVLEELRRQNDAQIQLINNLTDAWRADSARQHQETIDAVRASAQEMVPYNLTGYLDEFSKALAGEIRTLLGEVGRLHEQKRTLQFEIGSLLHMHSQYGPGGQFEPDWHPTMGPLAPPPPPGPGDMPPGGMGGPPPPGPDEPPPPARPAWRTVQQRAPRRRRTGRSEAQAPPAATLAPPEPIQHPPSWATWQPNLSFVPTPPPPGASPLVVPPSGPTGLFGPRSPRGTMYAG